MPPEAAAAVAKEKKRQKTPATKSAANPRFRGFPFKIKFSPKILMLVEKPFANGDFGWARAPEIQNSSN